MADRLLPSYLIMNMSPYLPPPRNPKFISLDANESPFDLPAPVRAEFIRNLRRLEFNRYPDGPATAVRQALARKFHVRPETIVLGNGSDELIACLILAVAGPRGLVVAPDPTFVMYERTAKICGARVKSIPLNDRFDLTPQFLNPALLRDAKLWFFAWPNNPTANCFSESILRQIIRRARGVVVVDEAYADFSGKTFLAGLKKHKNLVILRTFSKSRSAALGRVGYAVTSPEIARLIDIVRMPYNLSGTSQALALAILKHDRLMQPLVARALKNRDRLMRLLQSHPCFTPCPSDANFVLARVRECGWPTEGRPNRNAHAVAEGVGGEYRKRTARGRTGPALPHSPSNAKYIFAFFQSRGILIKAFHDGVLKDHVRITAGTDREMRAFERALHALESELFR